MDIVLSDLDAIHTQASMCSLYMQDYLYLLWYLPSQANLSFPSCPEVVD